MSVGSREQTIDLGKFTGKEESGKEQIPPDASFHPPLAYIPVPAHLARQTLLSPPHKDLLIH